MSTDLKQVWPTMAGQWEHNLPNTRHKFFFYNKKRRWNFFAQMINSMKNDQSMTDFLTVIQRIVDYQDNLDKF